MSDVVQIALFTLAAGFVTVVANAIFDRRGKRAAADLVTEQAESLKEETASVVRLTYQAMVEDLKERLTAVEIEQNTAIAQHGEMVKTLLAKIEGLNAEIERQSQLITSQTAIIADLRDQVSVLVIKLAAAGGEASGVDE